MSATKNFIERQANERGMDFSEYMDYMNPVPEFFEDLMFENSSQDIITLEEWWYSMHANESSVVTEELQLELDYDLKYEFEEER